MTPIPDAAAAAPETLDAEVAALLARLRERGEPALFADTDSAAGIAAARARFADLMAETARPVDRAPDLVTDGPVRLRVHRPAGDSAGANLVAGAALARRDAGTPAVVTLLVYPPPDFEGRYPSVRENAEGYYLTAADVVACSRLYLGGTSPRGEPRLSPLRAELAGLGPTIVATAGFDPLRDAGHAFADALAAAGVDVRPREHPSLTHGFLGFTGVSRACDARWLTPCEHFPVL